MDESVLISVITINRDNLVGLKKTMASVLTQTYNNFEYIIIDGGSTDGSSEYIFEHEQRLSFWISQPDDGIYEAMNKGILEAKGEFLLFLNSGDWLGGEHILHEVSSYLSGIDVLYGNMVKVFPTGKTLLDKGPEGDVITLNTFFRRTLNHSSSFIHKNLFKTYGLYDENLKIVSDWKFFLIALGLNNAKIKYLDLSISFFDMTGISNNNMALRDQEREMVLKEILPIPIYNDYIELKDLHAETNSVEFKRLKELNGNKVIRKFNSILFKVLIKGETK